MELFAVVITLASVELGSGVSRTEQTEDCRILRAPSLTWPAIEMAVDRHYSEAYGWKHERRALAWPGSIDTLLHSSIFWAESLNEERLPRSLPCFPEAVISRISQCLAVANDRPGVGPVTRLRMGLGIQPLAVQAGERWAKRANNLGIRRPRCIYPCEYLVGQRQTVIICQDELLWLRATVNGAEVVDAKSFGWGY